FPDSDRIERPLWRLIQRRSTTPRSSIPALLGHRSGPSRTPFRSCRTPFQCCPKTVRLQTGTLSDLNRNGVRQKSEPCPTSIGITVRFAPEYAQGVTFPETRANSSTIIGAGETADHVIAGSELDL